jgi:hypothetical protein
MYITLQSRLTSATKRLEQAKAELTEKPFSSQRQLHPKAMDSKLVITPTQSKK